MTRRSPVILRRSSYKGRYYEFFLSVFLSEMARIEYESAMVEERYSAGRRNYGTVTLLPMRKCTHLPKWGTSRASQCWRWPRAPAAPKGPCLSFWQSWKPRAFRAKGSRQNVSLFLTQHGLCRDAGARRLRLAGTERPCTRWKCNFHHRRLPAFTVCCGPKRR